MHKFLKSEEYFLPPPWPFPVSKTSSVGSGSNGHTYKEVIRTEKYLLEVGDITETSWLHVCISFYGQKHKSVCQENCLYTFRYLTCSTPSMCASISWMTLASLSASSAERRPLLIFSASRLMSLWASSKYAWSGWSSGVCLSRSLNKQHGHKYALISLHMSSLPLNTGWGQDQQSYILRYLNQQLISRNPLDRFNHQVTQSLFLLVLTHVLLSEWRMATRQGEKMTQESPKQQDNRL